MACNYEFQLPTGKVLMALPAGISQESDFTLDAFIKDLTVYMSNNPKAKEEFEQLLTTVSEQQYLEAKELSSANRKAVLEQMTAHLQQIGVPVTLCTSATMPRVGTERNASACVVNGQIYINTSKASVSDPMHEMMHLVFGVMKVDDYTLFKDVMQQMFKLKEAQEIYNTQLSTSYEGLMYYDKLEETFVRLISDLLLGKYDLLHNEELSTFLDNMSERLKPSIEKTFGIQMTDGLLDFLQSPVKHLTKRGSTLFIKKNYRTLGYTEHKQKVVESNRITQYIRDLINNGTIQENCE